MKNLFLRLVALSRAENHFVRGIYLENTLIGFLNDADMRGNTIELGYVITPKHWGKGYMTEALSAVLKYLLQNGYDEVRTGAFAENLASVRVMEKCGLHLDHEGEYSTFDGSETFPANFWKMVVED